MIIGKNEIDGYHLIHQDKIKENESLISPFPKVSPHWPGVGEYIGIVEDEQPILFVTNHLKEFNIFDYYDNFDFQKRRVYQDELDALNFPKYYGKSIKGLL